MFNVKIIDLSNRVHYNDRNFSYLQIGLSYVKLMTNSIMRSWFAKNYSISQYGRIYNMAKFEPIASQQISTNGYCEFYLYIGESHKHKVIIKKTKIWD